MTLADVERQRAAQAAGKVTVSLDSTGNVTLELDPVIANDIFETLQDLAGRLQGMAPAQGPLGRAQAYARLTATQKLLPQFQADAAAAGKLRRLGVLAAALTRARDAMAAQAVLRDNAPADAAPIDAIYNDTRTNKANTAHELANGAQLPDGTYFGGKRRAP